MQIHLIRKYSFVLLLLTWSSGILLHAQEFEDTSAVSSEASLLEQVYEHRISLLQDSLFLANEKLDANNILLRELEEQVGGMVDSLALSRAQVVQLTDSLSHLFILNDRARSENEQNLIRLSVLSDSLTQSFRYQSQLRALNDSLTIILARTQSYLASTSGTQRAYLDTVVALRSTLATLQEELASNEENIAGMYEQLQMTLSRPGEGAVDSAVDAKLISYIQQVAEYRLESSGLARLFQSRGGSDEIFLYKLNQFDQYITRLALGGHTPDALNLLAQAYIEQENSIKGALTYLKTLFLYPESEAGVQAKSELEKLLDRDSELGQLYYEIALNPDSMDVGEESFHRYYNYLGKIRNLTDVTSVDWFIVEAEKFLDMYPGFQQADEVLVWAGEAHHIRELYHSEILIYLKVRTLYPRSRYLPHVTYAMAEVTTNDLKNYQSGADSYARFLEEFPDDEKAPAALLAQADLYESELKNSQKAGELYRQLADTYPEDALATVSLFKYAQLLRTKLASPTGALVVYEELLTKYGAEPETGMGALEGLASISLDMRQFDAAVVYYLDIRERYPDEEERAVAAILQAADIYETQLKNLDAAIHTLHIILDNYPKYPGIKSVQRRVEKLQKKRG